MPDPKGRDRREAMMPTIAHPSHSPPSRLGEHRPTVPGEGEVYNSGQLDALLAVLLRIWRPRCCRGSWPTWPGPAGTGWTCSKYL